MADETFPRAIERLIDDVVDFAEQYIDEITKALAPDGVGFGMKKMTPQERVAEYMKLRGNPDAWAEWIGQRAGEIAARAEQSLSPDRVAQVKPWDIAARLAIQYGVKMEKEYLKAQEKQLRRVTGPEEAEDDLPV